MMALPTTSVALQITERKQTSPLTLGRVPLPALGPKELLLENVCASQAAGDRKRIDLDRRIPYLPFTIGWDVAGIVIAVGPEISRFEVGDRVTALSAATTSHTKGGYQQYPIVDEIATAKIPDNLSFEIASTTSLAWATVLPGIVRFKIFEDVSNAKFPLATQPPSVPPVLLWGASSSVGAMAVQLLKWCGFRVIATASTNNHAYAKKIGADIVIDYADSEKALEEIRKYSGGNLTLAYDAISLPATIPLCVKALGSKGGIVVTVAEVEKTANGGRQDVEVVYAAAYEIVMNPALRGGFQLLEDVLKAGMFIPLPIEVLPGGLLGFNEGLRRARADEISAQKLVYRISETPGLATL